MAVEGSFTAGRDSTAVANSFMAGCRRGLHPDRILRGRGLGLGPDRRLGLIRLDRLPDLGLARDPGRVRIRLGRRLDRDLVQVRARIRPDRRLRRHLAIGAAAGMSTR